MVGMLVLQRYINVKTLLKFSVIYEVEDLYDMVVKWVIENIASLNLYDMIEFGVLIEGLSKEKCDILNLCLTYIHYHVRDDLRIMSESWPLRNNLNCIKFLVQGDVSSYTLCQSSLTGSLMIVIPTLLLLS